MLQRLTKQIQTVLTVLCGAFLLASFLPGLGHFAYGAVAFGSYFALKSAWGSLRERSIDVDFLMVLAAAGAVVVGHVQDAAALLFLFSLSSTLEALALSRTKSAIEGLVKLRPTQAVLVREDKEERVPVESLQRGDLVRIPAFETVPVDAQVVEGRSAVDQSAMTGESIPVSKDVGSKLLAGTQNLDGMLLAKVEAPVGDSTLDKIVALVQDAQENKASGERISTWFGQRYTFFVVGAFAVAFGVRLVLGQAAGSALYSALTLLVALSPCALVISTPATTLSALAWAARNGILVRGGEFIERAGGIEVLALDKTGTLTTGRPELREICVCVGAPAMVGGGADCGSESGCWARGGTMSPESRRLLRLAAGVEQYASHPVAQAVMRAAEEQGVALPEAHDHRSFPGLGVRAQIDGQTVILGQERFLRDEGIDLPPGFVEHVRHLQKEGMTVGVLSSPHGLAAFGFGDSPRPEAKEFLQSVKDLGVRKVAMVTGDTPETAETVARSVGVEEVHAGLLPDQKTEIVARLGQSGNVMMVGDGVNDAPSLAQASVGVAMGGLGSDIAMNAADVVLMHDRLDRIPQLIRLGRRTNSIVKANLLFAAGMIVVLTVLSTFSEVDLRWFVLGHEGSTVLVILNGLRLLRGP